MAQTGRAAEAESLYAIVLRVDPEQPDTRENYLQVRALRLIKQGDEDWKADRRAATIEAYRGALGSLEEVLRMDPDNPSIRALTERVRRAIEHPPLDSAQAVGD
jgi:hypothetical protein